MIFIDRSFWLLPVLKISCHITDRTLREAAHMLSKIDPPNMVQLERFPCKNGKELLVFIAQPLKIYRPFSYEGRAYQRVGSTTSLMPSHTYQKLLLEKNHTNHRWESEPAKSARIFDLDQEEILRTVRLGIQSGRLPENIGDNISDILDRLGVQKEGQILNAAIVLFGTRFLPDYPQCQLRRAGGAISVALFDDRLEIWSDGTLPFDLRPEDLKKDHQSQPRNPLITNIFYRRGLIEQWGRGTQKIVELCVKAGHPEPEFLEQAGSVIVRFIPSGYVAPTRVAHNLSDRQRQILQLLAASVELSFPDLKKILPNPPADRTLRDDFQHLKRLNLISSRGRGRSARWYLL